MLRARLERRHRGNPIGQKGCCGKATWSLTSSAAQAPTTKKRDRFTPHPTVRGVRSGESPGNGCSS